MSEHVVVRLEVEGMRHQILNAFSQHQDEVRNVVAERLQAHLDAFSFGAEVDRVAGGIIREIVAGSVEDALRRAFASPEFRKKLDALMSEALRPAGERT